MKTEWEVVRSYYSAIDAGNIEKAGQFLSDDFKMLGTEPRTMDKEETLEIISNLKAGFPDLKYALSNIHADHGVVTLTAQAGGRHTQPLDLSNLGMGLLPESGKMIIFPPNQYEYTVASGKITVERNITPTTAFTGMSGFLRELGVVE